MNTQRSIGILYTAFASLVFVTTVISRISNSLPIIGALDIITIGCIFIFSLSIFIESKIMKALQVLMILLVCIGILMQGNYYLSLALFTNIFFIIFSYGLYNKYAKIKIFISIGLIYAMYFITSLHEGVAFVYSFNWIIFVVVHITSIWIVFRATVDKARKFDSSKEMQLHDKIDETSKELLLTRIQLIKTQEQLTDAVTSGIELLQMVKDMKNGKQ